MWISLASVTVLSSHDHKDWLQAVDHVDVPGVCAGALRVGMAMKHVGLGLPAAILLPSEECLTESKVGGVE